MTDTIVMCSCCVDDGGLDTSVSFGWTGYYLEKKLGSLRFLLVLAYLLLLSQLLLAAAAFVVAKTLLANVRHLSFVDDTNEQM